MIHRLLMRITRHRPMKQINVQGRPYLQRYFLRKAKDGTQYWLHRFLSADGERHLHNHPFWAKSVVLCGIYTQEIEVDGEVVTEHRQPLTRQNITPSTLHRIFWTVPDTWTLMVVDPGRLAEWCFFNDNGAWTAVPASFEDWWRDCGTRAGGDFKVVE